MQTIAIIPARSGSKRILNKNIKLFDGKPIIAYSIEAAQNSELFDSIIVSTDSQEIASIAKLYNASVPFMRPHELADDFAIIGDVMSHAVSWVQGKSNNLTAVCCINATTPLMHIEDLVKAYDTFKTNKWDYVISSASFSMPIQRAFTKLESNAIKMFNPQYYKTRSQDLPKAFYDAGQFYWGKPLAWLKKQKIFGSSTTIYEIPSWRVQDIDTLNDWERVEMLYNYIMKGQNN